MTMREGAAEAARRVLAAGGGRAGVGVILGTGQGGVVEWLDGACGLDAAVTGWLPSSTAIGHAGRIVCGRVGGVAVNLLQGRVHAYEGFPLETLVRGVHLLAALGATRLVVTNAAGGLRPDMTAGEILVITDHLDLVRLGGAEAPASAAPRPCYADHLAERAMMAARREGVAARKGVYAFVRGPSYETRAEYRMLRRIGADAVGMSTVPEVVAARGLGMEVVGVSVVTNVARPDAPGQTDADDVCHVAGAAAGGVWAILKAMLEP